MHYARIQDSEIEEPTLRMPIDAPSSLQAVSDTLDHMALPPSAPDFIERLFRRGYAVVRIDLLPAKVIFKGPQT